MDKAKKKPDWCRGTEAGIGRCPLCGILLARPRRIIQAHPPVKFNSRTVFWFPHRVLPHGIEVDETRVGGGIYLLDKLDDDKARH